MSAAFLEKLWNIGIIPTKWSLENCDKVLSFKYEFVIKKTGHFSWMVKTR